MQLSLRSARVAGHSVRSQTRAVAKPVRKVLMHAATEEKLELASSNGAVAPAATPANMMDFDELSDIIRMVHDTDIVEFELKSKRFSLSVKKKEALRAAETVVLHAPAASAPAALAPPAPVAAPGPAPAAAPAPPPPAPAAPAPPPALEGVQIASPMSGTMYRSPAPGEPPFVKEGDRVKKGQTVCLIEAMKLMNEIEAEVSGEVVKILVDNAQPVTPGQAIMLIRP